MKQLMQLTKVGNKYHVTHNDVAVITPCNHATMVKILNQDTTSRKYVTLSTACTGMSVSIVDTITELRQQFTTANLPSNQWYNVMIRELSSLHILFIPQLDMFVQYDEGIYREMEALRVERIISDYIDGRPEISITQLNIAIKQFIIHNLADYDEFNPDKWLNISNGILNRETKEMITHTAEKKFLYKLNVEYNSTPSLTPYWDRFCAETTPDSNKIIKFFNAMFLGKRENEMMLWLVGQPNSGKSTVTALIRMIYENNGLTTTNVSSLGASFGLQNITSGIVNLDDDISEGSFGNATISIFKKMMNEVATLDVNAKNVKQKTLTWKGFLMGCSNNLPIFGKGTNMNAVMKRVCFADFPHYFKKDKSFIAGIQSEVNDIFSKIINAPFELITEDIDEWMKDNLEFYYNHTNLVRRFVREKFCYCKESSAVLVCRVKSAHVYGYVRRRFEQEGIQYSKDYKALVNNEIEVLGGYMGHQSSVKYYFDIEKCENVLMVAGLEEDVEMDVDEV